MSSNAGPAVSVPDGYDLRMYETVTSTLDVARDLATNVQVPTWILAHAQTQARGRRGRAWHGDTGNLAATLLLPISEPADRAALRSFVAALALRSACVAVTGREDLFTVKWPNDVLVREGKLAGILLESIGSSGGRIDHLAIGIGVNLASAPAREEVEEGALRPLSLRGTCGIQPSPEAFLTTLADHYARFETQFRTFGFDPIRTAWLSHAARLGEVITARTTRETFTGTFADVDAQGQLVLETSKGAQRLPAAEIYF